jgi:outer membrane protein assembly factor BamB
LPVLTGEEYKMRNGLWTKGFVVVIILLFVGTRVLPSISGDIEIGSKSVLNQNDATSSVSSDDWPMFHHDLGHSGYSTSTGPETNNIRWSYKTNTAWSNPSIDNGKIYIDGGYKMYCLDANTGSKIWQYPINSNLATNTVANGKVYIGHSAYMYCLNADTGAKIWEYTTGFMVESSPAVANGKVYFSSCEDNENGKVLCLNADTGAKIWEYLTDSYMFSSPAVANGKVYIGSAFENKFYCLNADTGVKIWESSIGWLYSSAAVVNGKVYIGSDDGKVYCFNADTGEKIWDYSTGNSVQSSPAVTNNKVYVGSADGKVYCFNADTGEKIWDYTTGNSVHSSPAVADGKVYIGSNDYKVYCLNTDTGAEIWDYTTGADVGSSPAIANGMVYIASNDGKVYCFGSGHIDQPVIEIDQIKGGFGTSSAIKNNGTAAATNVPWWINVSGGIILSGGYTHNTITELAVNGTTTIKSSGLWGIGSIKIDVQVGDISKQAKAFLLGPLVLGVKQQ